MRIVFEEMSSWTPLTMNLGMTQHFRPNIYKANMFESLLRGFKILRVIEENAYLKKYSAESAVKF